MREPRTLVRQKWGDLFFCRFPPISLLSKGKTEMTQTARQLAATRKSEALALIDRLRAAVAAYDTNSDNYGVAGSLGHVAEIVEQAIEHIGA